MGEYIKTKNGSVKLGTCEDLFYVTYEQVKTMVNAGAKQEPGNAEPSAYLKPMIWRYRHPGLPLYDEASHNWDAKLDLAFYAPDESGPVWALKSEKLREDGSRLPVVWLNDGHGSRLESPEEIAELLTALDKQAESMSDQIAADCAAHIRRTMPGATPEPSTHEEAAVPAKPATEPTQSRRHLTTAEVRAILKANGIRSNRASVKCGSSLTYITVTIRDASVSAARVNKLMSPNNTWSMSMDDCVTGQSITVENSSYVEDVLAEPYLEAVQNATIPDHDGGGEYIVPGVILWRSRNDCYVASNSGHRGSNIWLRDLERRNPDTVRRLAIQIADILDRQANEGSQSPSVRSVPAVTQLAVVPAPPEFSTACYIG